MASSVLQRLTSAVALAAATVGEHDNAREEAEDWRDARLRLETLARITGAPSALQRMGLGGEAGYCGWEDTASQFASSAFYDLALTLHHALRPAVLLEAWQHFHEGRTPCAAVDVGTSLPGIEEGIWFDANFDSSQAVLAACRGRSLDGDLGGAVEAELREFRRRLQVLGDVLGTSTVTSGMPTIRDVLLGLSDEAAGSFQTDLLRRTHCCEEAAVALAQGAANFRVRAPVAAAALHAVLLHSDVQPNAPSPGVHHAFFHDLRVGLRFESLGQLLSLSDQAALQAAEIGVRTGQTTLYLLETLPHLQLLSVDHYADRDGDAHYEAVRSALQAFGDRALLLKMPSREAAELFKGSLDLVFLDADHSYNAVQQDINQWGAKVKQGGIVSGHDYNCRFPGVTGAVNERVAELGVPLHLGTDSVWWFRKP